MVVSEPLARVHLAAMLESLCYALEVRAMVIRIAVPGIFKGKIEGTIQCWKVQCKRLLESEEIKCTG